MELPEPAVDPCLAESIGHHLEASQGALERGKRLRQAVQVIQLSSETVLDLRNARRITRCGQTIQRRVVVAHGLGVCVARRCLVTSFDREVQGTRTVARSHEMTRALGGMHDVFCGKLVERICDTSVKSSPSMCWHILVQCLLDQRVREAVTLGAGSARFLEKPSAERCLERSERDGFWLIAGSQQEVDFELLACHARQLQ
jgi:hypothetical protein